MRFFRENSGETVELASSFTNIETLLIVLYAQIWPWVRTTLENAETQIQVEVTDEMMSFLGSCTNRLMPLSASRVKGLVMYMLKMYLGFGRKCPCYELRCDLLLRSRLYGLRSLC